MKIFKLTYGLMAATVLSLASCNINDYPEFDDADAFVAFSSGAVTAEEGGDAVKIPVLLTSLSGLSTTIEVQVVDSTAVEGKDFTIENKSLTFDKENPEQFVTINITNDNEYTGSRAFTLILKEGDVKLGAAKKCVVSIADDEHPLLFLFNTYKGSVTDAWGDSYDAEGYITRDADDDTKVWIYNLLTPWFVSASYTPRPFYGFVNAEKTEIQVPAGQETGYSSTTPIILYVAEDSDVNGTMYDSGKNMIIQILDGGATLKIVNAWGCSNGSSWYEANIGDVTLTKK